MMFVDSRNVSIQEINVSMIRTNFANPNQELSIGCLWDRMVDEDFPDDVLTK